MRTTAAVLHDVNKPYSIETVELDPPKRGEVLVKIGAAGICRSDLHFARGEATIALPAVLGHEGSGTVAAVGEGVTPGPRGRGRARGYAMLSTIRRMNDSTWPRSIQRTTTTRSCSGSIQITLLPAPRAE